MSDYQVIIVYMLPLTKWDEFAPFAKRFADTFQKFPPGLDNYKLITVVDIPGKECDELKAIGSQFELYLEGGRDVGAEQLMSHKYYNPNILIMGMSARCHFHRAGWLKRFMEARDKYGPGLYGSTGSWQVMPHIRSCGYMVDATILGNYPMLIDTTLKAAQFEHEQGNFHKYVLNKGFPSKQVTWDGEQDEPDWRSPAGVYWKPNQENVLVYDKYTDWWFESDPQQREQITRMGDGK